jgi:rRNA processing protein Gar1
VITRAITAGTVGTRPGIALIASKSQSIIITARGNIVGFIAKVVGDISVMLVCIVLRVWAAT